MHHNQSMDKYTHYYETSFVSLLPTDELRKLVTDASEYLMRMLCFTVIDHTIPSLPFFPPYLLFLSLSPPLQISMLHIEPSSQYTISFSLSRRILKFSALKRPTKKPENSNNLQKSPLHIMQNVQTRDTASIHVRNKVWCRYYPAFPSYNFSFLTRLQTLSYHPISSHPIPSHPISFHPISLGPCYIGHAAITAFPSSEMLATGISTDRKVLHVVPEAAEEAGDVVYAIQFNQINPYSLTGGMRVSEGVELKMGFKTRMGVNIPKSSSGFRSSNYSPSYVVHAVRQDERPSTMRQEVVLAPPKAEGKENIRQIHEGNGAEGGDYRAVTTSSLLPFYRMHSSYLTPLHILTLRYTPLATNPVPHELGAPKSFTSYDRPLPKKGQGKAITRKWRFKDTKDVFCVCCRGCNLGKKYQDRLYLDVAAHASAPSCSRNLAGTTLAMPDLGEAGRLGSWRNARTIPLRTMRSCNKNTLSERRICQGSDLEQVFKRVGLCSVEYNDMLKYAHMDLATLLAPKTRSKFEFKFVLEEGNQWRVDMVFTGHSVAISIAQTGQISTPYTLRDWSDQLKGVLNTNIIGPSCATRPDYMEKLKRYPTITKVKRPMTPIFGVSVVKRRAIQAPPRPYVTSLRS
ncbi:uncharacterized protein BDR25DRAFT_349535 [Lindgomyces ingoldianus]|uniref:Uncharacterized protein n=1 Tax=Lindgomyces ingoldianus TaxID=673940 RepID=A0ACB6RDN5_9PLEO|nr:uncharacterized protein BDR25DRAFT_349535 [Lindgomyces ingoldianus]KAF2476435.1 hypothetical protein BDR25DRAFT_349535 [Lindgomyces ingoldianus]